MAEKVVLHKMKQNIKKDVSSENRNDMLLKSILGNDVFKRVRRKYKNTDFFYIDTPVFTHGFFKYHLTGLENCEILSDIEHDLKHFLSFNYYLLLGQDWDEISVVYGYTGDKFLIMDAKRKNNFFFPTLIEETLTELLIRKGFFTSKGKDEYLRIRPLKINEHWKRKKGIFGK